MSSDPADLYAAQAAAVLVGARSCSVCGEATVRVGTDVQGIDSVANALARHSERYLTRIFTAQEVVDATGSHVSAPFPQEASGAASLAARYAVKEAVIKVLRPVHTGLRWADIEVVRQPGGWCTLALQGAAAEAAAASGLGPWSISFAHDAGVAVATVLARHDCGLGDVPDRRS